MPDKPVLIMGSAPNVTACAAWPSSRFSAIVAINNAWQVRPDWTHHIAPDDFPLDRAPKALETGQIRVTSSSYVPANNRYGGILYAGGTMAFTAGYWALAALKPSAMIFVGCDMIYPQDKRTHFYGTGTADPLRDDISLRNLEAKSARLMLHAVAQGCVCLRADTPESRLLFPIKTPEALEETASLPDAKAFNFVKAQEKELAYHVASGRYWESETPFSPAKLDAIDDLWLAALAA
jgi:hypothetical protein